MFKVGHPGLIGILTWRKLGEAQPGRGKSEKQKAGRMLRMAGDESKYRLGDNDNY